MRLTGRIAILVPKRVIDQLTNERTRHLPRETGGFLLGMRRGAHLEITGPTLQGTTDRATPVSFERRDRSHAAAAQAAWAARDGLIGLVGDWHSHPSGRAEPSEDDKRAWRDLVRATRSPSVGFIFADNGSLGVFVTRRSLPMGAVNSCHLIEETEDDLVFATD
jgi:integrative and conjugative element protein (TIGR02256 family)